MLTFLTSQFVPKESRSFSKVPFSTLELQKSLIEQNNPKPSNPKMPGSIVVVVEVDVVVVVVLVEVLVVVVASKL